MENENRNVRVTKKSKGSRKTNENGSSTSETHSQPPAQKAEDKTIFDLLFSEGSNEVLPPSPTPQPPSPPETEFPASKELVYVDFVTPFHLVDFQPSCHSRRDDREWFQ